VSAVFKCDRCGDPIDSEPIVLIGMRLAEKFTPHRVRTDLCQNCASELVEWLNEVRTNS